MKKLFVLLLAFLSTQSFAQKKTITLEDAVLGRGGLAPARLYQLNWLPGGNQYVYTAAQGKLVIGNAAKSTADTTDLDRSLLQMTNGNVPFMNWVSDKEFYFQTAKGIFGYNLATRKVTQWVTIPEKAEKLEIEPVSHNISFIQDEKLKVVVNGEERLIATPEKDGIVYGQTVHRSEFGINKGTFWSPKGNKLAYYRMDESMVATYPIFNLDDKPATAKLIRYPMAGATSHHVDVMVYDVVSKQNITLKVTGETDQYLTNIGWSPDEKSIYIAVVNRDQNHMWLNQYDAVSGMFVKTLFEETSDTYTEPQHPVRFLPDGKSFLWQSTRDGNNSIYQYSTDGKLLQQLAKGYMILDIAGVDNAGKNVFVQALSQDNISRICLIVSLKDGKATMIGKDGITNTPQVSSTGEYVINQETSLDIPRRYELFNVSNKKSTVLFDAPNPLADYITAQTELITSLKASDGTPLIARIIKPYNFDESKKYPVLIYVYGGPHAQMVSNTWLAGQDMWMQYLANKGFIVFTLDNRGSDNRNMKFQTAPFHHLGTVEMDDQMVGVNYLKSLPYVDGNRIGVDGWSYGGFMTISLMTRQPGVFKAAVAGGPVIDWSYYETMYGERYMGKPQTNPDGYKNNSLFNYIDNLQGKLMLIHGTSDDVVIWQNSLLYIKKCVEKGKQVDYMVYPGHQHNVGGKDRVHLIRKITDYFIDNL